MHVGFALDLDRAWGYCSSARTWLLHCKISERGYARRSFGRGVLSLKSHCALKAFFLVVVVLIDGQITLLSGVDCVRLLVLETPHVAMFLTLGRTNNRIRSPRLAAFGV